MLFSNLENLRFCQNISFTSRQKPKAISETKKNLCRKYRQQPFNIVEEKAVEPIDFCIYRIFIIIIIIFNYHYYILLA